MSQHTLVKKNFYYDYRELRSEFESYFINPRQAHQKRFVWDYWYVEDQYNLIRTPAYLYFQKKAYEKFHSFLVQWGRENLGCHDISPPWMSYYVDGCFQGLHSDVPHGPWAFVYSLTPNKKNFTGGETLILKQSTLDYWTHFNEQNEYELKSFVDRIPSFMNQLVVFDPRFPHGVTEVKGTRDPLQSRLVIHGWFVNPRPYVVGGLSTNQVQKSLDGLFDALSEKLKSMELLNGAVSIRLNVNSFGEVVQTKVLTNTLISIRQNKEADFLICDLKKLFKNIRFPKTRKSSQITIPLLFK